MPNIKVAPIVDADTAVSQLDAAMTEKIEELVQLKFAKYLNDKIDSTLSMRAVAGQFNLNNEAMWTLQRNISDTIADGVADRLGSSWDFINSVGEQVPYPQIDYAELGEHLRDNDANLELNAIQTSILNSSRFRTFIATELENQFLRWMRSNDVASILDEAMLRIAPQVASLVMKQFVTMFKANADV